MYLPAPGGSARAGRAGGGRGGGALTALTAQPLPRALEPAASKAADPASCGPQECNEGLEVACDQLSREEQAKLEWLARQEVPAWGAYARGMAAAGYPVAEAPRDAQAEVSAEVSAEATAKRSPTPEEVAKAESNPNPFPRPEPQPQTPNPNSNPQPQTPNPNSKPQLQP